VNVIELKSVGVKPEGVKSERVKPERVKSERVKPEGVKPEGVKPERVKPEGTKPLEISNKSIEDHHNHAFASPVPQKDIYSCGCGSCECGENGSELSEKNRKSVKEQLFKGIKYACIELLSYFQVNVYLDPACGIISYVIPESFIKITLVTASGRFLSCF
jgi:hypothetical protein